MTNYRIFKRIEKKIEKSSVNPIAAFDHKYMKSTIIQFKGKKKLKDHLLNFEKFLIELKGKPGQSSVNRLLNNPSIVNPLPLKDTMKVDSL